MASLIIFITVILSLATRADGQCRNHSHAEHERFLAPLFTGNYTIQDEKFTYVIGICSKAKVSECKVLTDANNAAVVQQDQQGDCHVLGRNSSAQIAKGRDWLELLYTNGDVYRHHCGGSARKTRIMFVCDPGAGNGRPNFLEENKEDQECSYLFEWSTSLICSNTGSSGLSPGSIVLIVVFSLVVAYLLFGFLYQRYVVGAKGMEQIPNFDFWRKIGNLAADGCDMVCRCSEKAPPAQYKIHENLQVDDDDDDSEKDDTLLPM